MIRFKVNRNISKPEVLESRLQMASVSVVVHVRCHVRCHWSFHVTYRYLSDLFELTQSWLLLLGNYEVLVTTVVQTALQQLRVWEIQQDNSLLLSVTAYYLLLLLSLS